MRRILLATALLIAAAGCSNNRGSESMDPVERLVSKRYIKSTDDFGPHRVTSVLEVEASGEGGVNTQTLTEELRVDDVGNYHVIRREHGSAAPWELVCIGSTYYVVQPDGAIETLQPGMLGQTTRERVAESWRTVLEPFEGAIEIQETGQAEIEGRKVTIHSLKLKEGATGEGNVKPLELSGKVQVDDATGFPLAVDLRGSYLRRDADDPEKQPVNVKIEKYEFRIKDFDKVSKVENPSLRKKRGGKSR